MPVAFDPSPYRASAASRFGGSLSSFTRPSRYTAISSTRSSARFIGLGGEGHVRQHRRPASIGGTGAISAPSQGA
ncbi:hypothetical protein [Frankia tisae]|uniref:hypothetical protein n=1 Tax=Frankia tisae TaxID=2950104 RepID=UPI0021C1DDDC|nr:hypothetical protein [Frankia tisae]